MVASVETHLASLLPEQKEPSISDEEFMKFELGYLRDRGITGNDEISAWNEERGKAFRAYLEYEAPDDLIEQLRSKDEKIRKHAFAVIAESIE